MEAKIEKISELSKLSSIKTRMNDDLFHLLVSLASDTCYLAFHWRNMTEFPLRSWSFLIAYFALWVRASTVYASRCNGHLVG